MSRPTPPTPEEQTDSDLAALIEDLTDRLNAGEAVDLQRYIEQHPRQAEELLCLMPALELLLSAGGTPPEESQSGSTAGLSPAPAHGILGDFRILREVGRGGMGVVYEAEQRSLGRRVALKVLPFAAALDPRHLQRFKNEAQAAAQLHHSNIVPVYAVGSERGVHYFAMQFIDGLSLAQVIDRLRRETSAREQSGSPNDAAAPADTPLAGLTTAGPARGSEFFRVAARLGVQAAEALDHAHQQGVIHRDVKPANLLLDGTGSLWVADFGLARGRSETGLTGAAIVGTLRYMSPEQALAKRALVDHRSDIYALGATLYELLTLEPAYPGTDREELLRQIALGEPRPPRRVNPAVPVALETVVLKTMAREPEGRYQTAQELADDLRRFLDGRPVLAARPTLLDRLWRRIRRHRSAVLTAVAGLLLALVGLFIADVVLWQERERTKEALQKAERNEAEADRQRRRAEANFRKALQGATDMLVQLDPVAGRPPPQGDELRQALIRQGLAFFQRFIDEKHPAPAVRFESSQAYENMACVYFSQRDAANARAMMDKAFALLDGLVAEYPENDSYRKKRIQAHYLTALCYKSSGLPTEAQGEYLRTAQLCRLASLNDRSGAALNAAAWFLVDCPDEKFRDPPLAVALADQAVQRDPQEGAYWNTLGIACYRAGQWDRARSALEKSMELREGGDAHDWFFLAMTHVRQGDIDRGRAWLEKASRWMRQHGRRDENLTRYRAEAEALLGE
jgi:serine/threonine protein kinase/Tfp pilus assembly protein PilF